MEGLEEICFEIISHSGQAKAYLMDALEKSRSDAADFKDIQQIIINAKEELKLAQTQHLKVLSDFAKTKANIVNPLYSHAEDQMMSAEIFLDLIRELIKTNEELNELKKQI